MRHQKKTRRFGLPTAQRKMLFRNLVTSLLKHEKIEITEIKAMELRSLAEQMITLGKRKDLHARRQALAVITEKDVVKKLFDVLAPRYQERHGGYTRVTKIGPRRGDAAQMAVIELIKD